MGRLVVDASALIDYLTAGAQRPRFSEHLRSNDLHVPEVCDVEVVSGFRRAMFGGFLAPRAMELLLIDYAELPLRRHRHLPLVGRAFDLRDNFATADAMYVALAERLHAALLTSDQRLARATRRHTSVAILR